MRVFDCCLSSVISLTMNCALYRNEAMSDLQKVVSELENKNEELRLSVEGVRHSVEEKLLSPTAIRPASPSPPR